MTKKWTGLLGLVAMLAVAAIAVVIATDNDDDADAEPRQAVDAVSTDCSAFDAGTELEQPDDMPDPVYEAALSIARAATACDYEKLARLAGDEFQFSFGGLTGGEAAAEEWKAAENRGEPVLRTLHDLLIGAYELDGPRFVWPSTDTTDYRTGIDTGGNWLFFVAGD
jgi:hypothetical protein